MNLYNCILGCLIEMSGIYNYRDILLGDFIQGQFVLRDYILGDLVLDKLSSQGIKYTSAHKFWDRMEGWFQKMVAKSVDLW